jgi:hypothetical protein
MNPTQVKVFCAHTHKVLEEIVNEWLNESDPIHAIYIENIAQSSESEAGGIYLTVFYHKGLGGAE